VAWLVGKGRKLDVLSIVKRKDALGLLAHSDSEERFTQTRTEMRGAHPDRLRWDGGRGAVLRRSRRCWSRLTTTPATSCWPTATLSKLCATPCWSAMS
jgi:hypothetical protein